ncbi:DUF2254 domain-containing protein [soil metagenome]
MQRLSHLWEELSSSLWFIPFLIILGAVALAGGLIQADIHIDSRTWEDWPYLFGAGAAGARGMLGAVASSMITVAGVAFSITIVALSLTSSQYTSRVLRNFMGDRVNQAVLGVFVGIFAYCLVVLRTIRGGDEGAFVPPLAVLGGVVLAFVGISCLIFFIHHIATAIQAAQILRAVASETEAAISRLFPEGLGEEKETLDNTLPVPPKVKAWQSVPALATGYVQGVDESALLRFAREKRLIVRMECGVGEFVIAGTSLASVTGEAAPDEAGTEGLNSAYTLGPQRTMGQDAGFGFRQIVDVALKALSPGINDTTTAIMCVDRLASLLVRLARRHIEKDWRMEGGELRVIARGPSFASLLAESFDQIRQNAGGNVAVLDRLLWANGLLADEVRGSRREALLRQVEAVGEVIGRTIPAPLDRAALEARFDGLKRRLEARDPEEVKLFHR